MQITDPINNPRLFIEKTKADALQQLRPGQTLQVQVTAPTTKGTVQLRIGENEIKAKTQMQLNAGEKLLISVMKAGKTPEFMVIREPSIKSIQAQFLKTILPKQIPLQQLLSGLETIKQVSANPTVTSSPAVQATAATKESIADLFKQIIQTINSKNLQQTQLTTLDIKQLQAQSTTADIKQLQAQSTATDIKQLQAQSTNADIKQLQAQPVATGNKAPDLPLPVLADTKASHINKLQTLFTVLAGAITQKMPAPSNLTTTNPTQVLTQRIQEVLSFIPNQNRAVTADRVKQALDLSGLFLEAKLSAGKIPEADMKTALLKLLMEVQLNTSMDPSQIQHASIRNAATPGEALTAMAARFFAELQAQTEGSLARIQMHQLASLPQEEGQKQLWQFELPIRHNDETHGFLVRLEREQKASENGVDDCWSVTLDFDIEPAGAICAKLSLTGDEISSAFLTQRPESVTLVEKHLPRLSEAFTRAGLKVGSLSTRQEIAPKSTEQQLAPFPLLDEKA